LLLLVSGPFGLSLLLPGQLLLLKPLPLGLGFGLCLSFQGLLLLQVKLLQTLPLDLGLG
jgi:hypothetical protein